MFDKTLITTYITSKFAKGEAHKLERPRTFKLSANKKTSFRKLHFAPSAGPLPSVDKDVATRHENKLKTVNLLIKLLL